MNKKFTAFFAGYNMAVTGNSAYGMMHGYETSATVSTFDNVAPLKIHVSFYATDDQKRAIEASIRNLALKFFIMQFSPYGLTMGFNDFTVGRLLKRLPAVLDSIFRIFSENGATTGEYCPVCGNPLNAENLKKCNIDGFTVTIDNDCVNTINSVISAENQDFANAPNNCLQGFFGAFIGGLVGIGVSIGFYHIGLISSLSAIIAALLGAFLYQRFRGKPNKIMIIIVSVTTVVMIAASVPIAYLVETALEASKHPELAGYPATELFRLMMQTDPELSRAFYTDLALSFVFSALGIALVIATLLKKIRRKKNI